MSTDSTLRDDFNRRVDGSVSRLIGSYRVVLKSGVVENSLVPHAHVHLATAVANVELHAQAMVDQVNELRFQHTTIR